MVLARVLRNIRVRISRWVNLKYPPVVARGTTMAAVKIVIPTALRQYVGNLDAVEVDAKNVKEALDDLVARFDLLRRHLYADDGYLRNVVHVYVNGADIRYVRVDATLLHQYRTMSIVPSIAIGSF